MYYFSSLIWIHFRTCLFGLIPFNNYSEYYSNDHVDVRDDPNLCERTLDCVCVQCMPTLWKACWVKQEREKAVEEAIELLKILENELKDKKYFGGENVNIVDIAGIFIAHWLPAFQQFCGVEILKEERFPKLCQWSDEFVNRSVVKEVFPPRDKLTAFFKARFESNHYN